MWHNKTSPIAGQFGCHHTELHRTWLVAIYLCFRQNFVVSLVADLVREWWCLYTATISKWWPCTYLSIYSISKLNMGLKNYTQWGQEMNNCLFCMYGLIVSAALPLWYSWYDSALSHWSWESSKRGLLHTLAQSCKPTQSTRSFIGIDTNPYCGTRLLSLFMASWPGGIYHIGHNLHSAQCKSN